MSKEQLITRLHAIKEAATLVMQTRAAMLADRTPTTIEQHKAALAKWRAAYTERKKNG